VHEVAYTDGRLGEEAGLLHCNPSLAGSPPEVTQLS
jgi:hypothetical protein